MDSLYQIGSYGDLTNMVYADIMDRARACFARTAQEKAALTSPEAVRVWQERMRQAFFAALGGLPAETCELAPTWGELREREGYSVQNVLFWAAPGVPVTASIWRPLGFDGPRPAVLFPCGHHEFPREAPEYQETCTWFALNGYVTLAFDPPGQGERKLCWDPVLQRSFAGTGSAEHEHRGRQCELLGHNIARYFVRDGMRAFDLLASLPEVDAARIAVTGNSGGGTQSSYLMLADDRLACGMPCTFTTDRQLYMGRTHWHDAEQNLTGAIPAGLDYDDFYAVFAPRPAAIGAVTWDFFPIEGTRRAFERLQRVYRALEAEEQVALFEVETGHSYHPTLRRKAIEWFNRWLQPEATFRAPEHFEPEPPESMRNTASGQVSVSLPQCLDLPALNARSLAAIVRPASPPAGADLARRLGLPAEYPAAAPRVLAEREEGALTLRKSFLIGGFGHTPDHLTIVPLLRLAPPQPNRVLVYCCEEGIAGIDAAGEARLRRLAEAGAAVYIAEPRGSGETASRRLSPWDPGWLTETWLSQYYRMLGTSLGALRAYDLAAALRTVREELPGLPVGLMGRGFAGWAATLAAALDSGVDRICLEQMPYAVGPYAVHHAVSPPEAYTIPGVLALGDLPGFLRAGGVSQALIVDPLSPAHDRLTEQQWQAEAAPLWEVLPEVQVLCRAQASAAGAAVLAFWAP